MNQVSDSSRSILCAWIFGVQKVGAVRQSTQKMILPFLVKCASQMISRNRLRVEAHNKCGVDVTEYQLGRPITAIHQSLIDSMDQTWTIQESQVQLQLRRILRRTTHPVEKFQSFVLANFLGTSIFIVFH